LKQTVGSTDPKVIPDFSADTLKEAALQEN